MSQPLLLRAMVHRRWHQEIKSLLIACDRNPAQTALQDGGRIYQFMKLKNSMQHSFRHGWIQRHKQSSRALCLSTSFSQSLPHEGHLNTNCLRLETYILLAYGGKTVFTAMLTKIGTESSGPIRVTCPWLNQRTMAGWMGCSELRDLDLESTPESRQKLQMQSTPSEKQRREQIPRRKRGSINRRQHTESQVLSREGWV